MDQFSNPSAVAPFRAGYLLLMGGSSGSDARHSLSLQYGEVKTADAIPTYESITFTDVVNPAQPTSTVTQNGVFSGTVPYLFALDANTTQAVYIGYENGSIGIWGHTFYDDGSNLLRVASYQQLASDAPLVPSVGVATIPGLSGFLVAYQISGDPETHLSWCSLPTYTPGQPLELSITALASLTTPPAGGSLSLVVVVNETVLPGGASCVGFLGVAEPPGQPEALALTVFPVTITAGSPAIGDPLVSTTATGNGWPGFGFFRGVDTLPYYQVASGDFTVGTVAIDGTLAGGVSLGISGVSKPAPVYYTFGDFAPEPAVGDTVIVDVYRTFLFDVGHGNISQIGQAQRVVFEQDAPTNQVGPVIGIIDSGPPVPNSNVAVLNAGSVEGFTTFGDTVTSTTGWSISTSIGGFFQISGSDGIPDAFSVSEQFKVTFAATGSFSQQVTTQEISSYVGNSDTISSDGEVIVNPQGVALVGGTSFICYQYTMLDATGKPIPGSPPYYELYPLAWTIDAVPFDYDSDSTVYIVPGILSSYEMDETALNALIETGLLVSNSWGSYSWSTPGSASVGHNFISGGSKSVGASLNFEASVGASFGPPDDTFSVSAGVQASFNFNYTWTTSESDQVATTIGLPALNDPPPPNAFSSYAYDVLLLKHNTQHLTDLITMLESNPTPNNVAALKRMAPSSAPWRIVHVVTNSTLA